MAYTPVPATQSTGSASLAHLATVYYRKRALDALRKKFVFQELCMRDMLPRQSGKTVQFFRYTQLTANTTPKSPEGAVGTSIGIGSRTVSATISQYTNYITVSDLLKDTAIDPIVANAADLLGYQAGLSVDTITRNIFDAESASTNQALLGTYLKLADLRSSRHQLQGVDVQPMDDGYFDTVLHPYVSYDVINDPAANGLADIFKYTKPQEASLVRYQDRGEITVAAGCRLVESTNVTKINGAPNKWRCYVVGKNAVGCVDLEGRGPSRIKDPNKQRFDISVIQGEKSIADPEGVIGAAVSYNFSFVTVVLEGPAGIGGTYRFKTLDAPSSIVA